MPSGLVNKRPQMSKQLELPLGGGGEAPKTGRSGEAMAATRGNRRSGTSALMEQVVEASNLRSALKRVRRNKGSPGIDGMTVNELAGYLREHWPTLREQLLRGEYQPQPVLVRYIPKAGGGTRMLGIPTAVDRFIQQALLQVLQPMIDPTFSLHSHGFRPGRSAHGALKEAKGHVETGRCWVVDVDLAKFFDCVNHDLLMGRMEKRVEDRRALGLIRRYLETGLMSDGVVMRRHQGTPQGGPLSPLLANVLLDDVDKELERRGHAFVRYADDCNVYVRSERAGQRVMGLLRRLYGRLQLDINEDKSAVAMVWHRPFLGYQLYKNRGKVGFAIAGKSIARFKDQVRDMTRRVCGRSMEQVARKLSSYITGWKQYFQLAPGRERRRRLDGWIRRRLRALQLKQWKNCRTIYRNIRRLGGEYLTALRVTRLTGRWWRAAGEASLALPTSYFDKLGISKLVS